MNPFFNKVLRQYWLALFVIVMGLLSAYTSSPIYGAPAETPTPDVQTVPKPIMMDTPTNTPFPTPTPSDNTDAPSGGAPAPTRTPNNHNDGDNNNSDNNNNQNNNSTGADNATSTPAAGNAGPATGTANTGATGGLTGIVNAVTLNMRKGPSTTDHIVDTLFKNDQVTVSGRDSAGAWWYVCCGAGAQRTGWVSAQFITPNFASSEAATLLPVLVNSAAPAAPQSTATAVQANGTPQATDVPAASTPAAETTSPLLMTMRAQPPFVWQGQQIQLQLTLRNSGSQPLTKVQLRNDLPAEVALLATTVSDGGTYRYTGDAAKGPLLTIDWGTLPAAAQVTATLTLQIRADTPIGDLIDNLAQATSAEGAEALAGLTLAMPPTGLPQFR